MAVLMDLDELAERRADRVQEELLAQCRAEQIEPSVLQGKPSAGQT
ncbi:MAG: hypothetical protein ACRDOD_15965 [Streptosporangiaceae bacterium]